jgi:hypothetical protein
MLAQLPVTQSCFYNVDEQGIHVFTFTSPSQQAADTWLDVLSVLYETIPTHKLALFILDMRQSGLLPLVYTLRAGRRWLIEHPIKHDVRFACLTDHNFPLSVAEKFLRLNIGVDQRVVRFFGPDQDHRAVDWLLNR